MLLGLQNFLRSAGKDYSHYLRSNPLSGDDILIFSMNLFVFSKICCFRKEIEERDECGRELFDSIMFLENGEYREKVEEKTNQSWLVCTGKVITARQ